MVGVRAVLAIVQLVCRRKLGLPRLVVRLLLQLLRAQRVNIHVAVPAALGCTPVITLLIGHLDETAGEALVLSIPVVYLCLVLISPIMFREIILNKMGSFHSGGTA